MTWRSRRGRAKAHPGLAPLQSPGRRMWLFARSGRLVWPWRHASVTRLRGWARVLTGRDAEQVGHVLDQQALVEDIRPPPRLEGVDHPDEVIAVVLVPPPLSRYMGCTCKAYVRP